jgi:hypothetical protein
MILLQYDLSSYSATLFGAMSLMLAGNGLRLKEVGDFNDEICLTAMNLLRSTKLHLTTEPLNSCRYCYQLVFYPLLLLLD